MHPQGTGTVPNVGQKAEDLTRLRFAGPPQTDSLRKNTNTDKELFEGNRWQVKLQGTEFIQTPYTGFD